MENITRTVFGSYLQTCMLMGLPFSVMPNTTLNEKFGIQAGVLPDITVIPNMRYYAIGNKGHQLSVGANGLTKSDPVQHRATDAACYNHLPFVLRTMDNDLAPADRANYGLRRQEVHGGLQYIAYYLKRIDLSTSVPGMERVSVADGVSTTSAFVADTSNLNPTPPDLSSSGVNVVTGDYVAASSKLPLVLSADDTAELLDVARILYDDENYAIISEIALVSGVDKVVPSPALGGTTINFNEVIAAQVVTHINTLFAVKYNNDGNQLLLDVGATEPLLKLV